jgi:HEPN domain-containing protein
VREDTRNWIESSEYDLDTARDLFKAGRHVYVIFMCHLALEKMRKAHVTEVIQAEPAKTHSLEYLIRKAKLEPPPEMREFLGKITSQSAPTRHPGDFGEFLAGLAPELPGSACALPRRR